MTGKAKRKVVVRGNRKLPPEVESVLRFVSENMKLSGFNGTITPETEEHVLRLYRAGKLKRRKPLFRPR